jgi:hypothetical protein
MSKCLICGKGEMSPEYRDVFYVGGFEHKLILRKCNYCKEIIVIRADVMEKKDEEKPC